MIRVRHRETGDVRMLGESAFPYFAGTYERIDESASNRPAAAGKPAPDTGTTTPGKAPTTEKE
jgi:hypothetical protein